jgi:hypothetical protein
MVPVILSYKASKLPPLDILPAFALSGSVSINKPDLLFCRLVKLVDQSIYLPICGLLIFLFHANNNRNDPSVKKKSSQGHEGLKEQQDKISRWIIKLDKVKCYLISFFNPAPTIFRHALID